MPMRRFFANDSFWNKPLSENAEIDPDSERYIELLTGSKDGPYLGINLHRWTIPVYKVDDSTPRRTVHQMIHREEDLIARNSRWRGMGNRFRHGPGFGRDVPIPDGVSEDHERDRHMAMVDWKNNLAWDMWGVYLGEGGEWRSNTGMVYPIDSPGVFNPLDFPIKDGESIHFYGPSRASGVPAIAGLIMHDEITAGQIEHKLAFACNFNAYQKFVWPAIWTDGKCEFGIPEGAIIQLDPTFDLDRIELSPVAKTVARALQKYGAVNVDGAGSNSLYGEGLWDNPTKSWEGLLEPLELKAIHLKHFRVLKVGKIKHGGDARLHDGIGQ